MPQRRVFQAQLLDLMLRKVADRKALADMHLTGEWLQFAAEQLEQCRFARAIGAKEADALAGQQ